MARKVGRNEPCPCGSGDKYKHCHGSPQKEAETAKTSQYATMAIVGGLLALGLGGFAAAMISYEPPARQGDLTWSEAHGHWHDANGKKVDTTSGRPIPPPPGPAPEGKVWSEAHGHYHDEDGGEPEGDEAHL